MKRWLVFTVSALFALHCNRSVRSTENPAAPPSSKPGSSESGTQTPSSSTAQRTPAGARFPTSFADLAAKAKPAVVSVKTIQRSEPSGRGRGEGWATAFIFDASGLILTNHHVIQGAETIRVIFESQRELKAEVVGVDPPTDVAVLRVQGRNFSHLPLGDSDALQVGDWVVAIGNPYGLSHTVSAGILSGKGRTSHEVQGLDASGYYNFLQTDASINPGNSGGPLLDTEGRVVGINTAINQRANNIGFAIPINMIKALIPRLVKDGSIRRSAIGVTVKPVPSEPTSDQGVAQRPGSIIQQVFPGGPADTAGLKEGDIIVAFEGHAIRGPEQLRWLASLAGVGRRAKVKVLRGKRTLTLSLTMGDLQPHDSGR